MKRRRLKQILNVLSNLILPEFTLKWQNLPWSIKIMKPIIQEKNCRNS